MRRFVLYQSQAEHSADCELFPFETIPRRIFLDTNIVDCLVKWPSCIFEMVETPPELDLTLQEDIESLMHIFKVGSRAQWNIVVSEKTVDELSQTKNASLREELLEYGMDLVGYGASNNRDEDRNYANDLARRLRDSTLVAALPDVNDRDLIAHAIALRCDVFCTRDRKSIHRKKNRLQALPLRILTPAEWWAHIKPWAGLWW
jgi:hypothetical protein